MTKNLASDYVPSEHWELAVADSILAHVPSDLAGTVLVAPAGIGVFAKLLADALPNARRVMFASAHSERLDSVRAALEGSACPAFFAQQAFSDMAYAPGVFQAAFNVHGLVDAATFRNRASDLSSMVESGGVLGIAALGHGSLATAFELLREEVDANSPELADALADYDARRLTGAQVDESLAALGLDIVAGGAREVHIAGSAAALLADALLGETVAPFWEAFDPAVWRGAVSRLDTYFEGERVMDTLELQWRVATVPILEVEDALIEDVGNAPEGTPVV